MYVLSVASQLHFSATPRRCSHKSVHQPLQQARIVHRGPGSDDYCSPQIRRVSCTRIVFLLTWMVMLLPIFATSHQLSDIFPTDTSMPAYHKISTDLDIPRLQYICQIFRGHGACRVCRRQSGRDPDGTEVVEQDWLHAPARHRGLCVRHQSDNPAAMM